MKRILPGRCTLIVGLLFPTITGTRADTTNLFPIADTALRDAVPGNNFGAVQSLPAGVGFNGLPRNRTLFKFDLSALPTNASVISVSLRIAVTSTGRGPANYDLHRLLRDWGEGVKGGSSTAGAPADAGEATWNSRFHPSTAWGAGGGLAGTDYAASASATALLNTAGSTSTFASPGLLADVEIWRAHPGTNFGWIMIAQGEASGSGKQVASRESTAQPGLEIEYTLPLEPPPPNPPVITDPLVLAGEFLFSLLAESNRAYTVSYRDSITATNWSVLTNIAAQPVERTIQITNPIAPGERYFGVSSP
jgi:hypothetical protein